MSCSVLKCVAVCCSASQCVALCCGVVQRVAVCCSARGESEGQASSTVKPAIAAIWKSVYFGICIWIVHVTFKCVITLTNDFEKWRFRKKIGLLTRHASFHDSCKSHFFFSHTCERGMSHMNELWHICKTGGKLAFWRVLWKRAYHQDLVKLLLRVSRVYVCRDSFVNVLRLIHMWNASFMREYVLTRAREALVTCESSVYVSEYVAGHIYICAKTHSHVKCLVHVWTRAYHIECVRLVLRVNLVYMWVTMWVYMCRDSIIYVPRLIHMWHAFIMRGYVLST